MTKAKEPNQPVAGLRLIAVWKLAKAALMVGVAVGLFDLINRNLDEAARTLVAHLHLDPENYVVRWLLGKIEKIDPHSFRRYGILSLVVSLELVIEGVGLWLNKTWAKYMVLIATAFFIPEEAYYCVTHVNGERLALLILNLGILAYVARTIWGPRARQA